MSYTAFTMLKLVLKQADCMPKVLLSSDVQCDVDDVINCFHEAGFVPVRARGSKRWTIVAKNEQEQQDLLKLATEILSISSKDLDQTYINLSISVKTLVLTQHWKITCRYLCGTREELIDLFSENCEKKPLRKKRGDPTYVSSATGDPLDQERPAVCMHLLKAEAGESMPSHLYRLSGGTDSPTKKSSSSTTTMEDSNMPDGYVLPINIAWKSPVKDTSHPCYTKNCTSPLTATQENGTQSSHNKWKEENLLSQEDLTKSPTTIDPWDKAKEIYEDPKWHPEF